LASSGADGTVRLWKSGFKKWMVLIEILNINRHLPELVEMHQRSEAHGTWRGRNLAKKHCLIRFFRQEIGLHSYVVLCQFSFYYINFELLDQCHH